MLRVDFCIARGPETQNLIFGDSRDQLSYSSILRRKNGQRRTELKENPLEAERTHGKAFMGRDCPGHGCGEGGLVGMGRLRW